MQAIIEVVTNKNERGGGSLSVGINKAIDEFLSDQKVELVNFKLEGTVFNEDKTGRTLVVIDAKPKTAPNKK